MNEIQQLMSIAITFIKNCSKKYQKKGICSIFPQTNNVSDASYEIFKGIQHMFKLMKSFTTFLQQLSRRKIA